MAVVRGAARRVPRARPRRGGAGPARPGRLPPWRLLSPGRGIARRERATDPAGRGRRARRDPRDGGRALATAPLEAPRANRGGLEPRRSGAGLAGRRRSCRDAHRGARRARTPPREPPRSPRRGAAGRARALALHQHRRLPADVAAHRRGQVPCARGRGRRGRRPLGPTRTRGARDVGRRVTEGDHGQRVALGGCYGAGAPRARPDTPRRAGCLRSPPVPRHGRRRVHGSTMQGRVFCGACERPFAEQRATCPHCGQHAT